MARRTRRTEASDLGAASDRALVGCRLGTPGVVSRPIVASFLGAGVSDETRRSLRHGANPLADQLAHLAVLADRDLDRAVEGILRIAAALGARGPLHERPRGSGGVALAEAQAVAIGDALEAAFADLGIEGERRDQALTVVQVRFEQVRDGETFEPWFPR